MSLGMSHYAGFIGRPIVTSERK